MRKIAVYGKGGIGKSTTTSNISAALADMGYRVLQIGCDPKADSTKNLMHGKKITSVLDAIREKGEGNITPGDVLFQGYGGVWCVEAGGPTPGIGCAGRGIITAFEKLEEIGAYEIAGRISFFTMCWETWSVEALRCRSGAVTREMYLS